MQRYEMLHKNNRMKAKNLLLTLYQNEELLTTVRKEILTAPFYFTFHYANGHFYPQSVLFPLRMCIAF